MLPLFGVLLFALIGIGALVIDGGLALTEQARLETAAEMMVSELAYIESLPDSQLNPACVASGATRTACAEEFYLAPILAPLGIEFASGADGAEWQRSDRALDGAVIDSRGARLGELGDPELVGSATPQRSVRLRRSSPLLFGWAALAPRTAGGERTDFAAVQAARAAEGISPDVSGSGLRADGFALQAEASIDLAGGVPAMRVGPWLDTPTGPTAGVIGVAWLLDDLVSLGGFASRWESSDPDTHLVQVGNRLETVDGATVGCFFQVPTTGAYVGQMIGGDLPGTIAYAGSLSATRWDAAYVPVVRNCDSASPILGFLELAVDAATVPDVVVGPSVPTRRNASGTPSSVRQAAAAARVWNDPDLASSRAWRSDGDGLALALRVPRLTSDPYAERRLAAGNR